MTKKYRINVSFPQYDKHIYDYIKSQDNPSAFIRKLVESQMNSTLGNAFFNNTRKMVEEDSEEDEIVVQDVATGKVSIEYEATDLDEILNLNF